MINKYTLKIEGVKMVPEVESRIYDMLNITLFSAIIYTLFGFCSELLFTVILAGSNSEKNHPYIMLSTTAGSLTVVALSWYLSKKRNIHFPGFAISIASIVAIMKFEGMLTTNFLYSDMAATYSLYRLLIK